MSEINDNEELPDGIFPINLKCIDQYQRKDPSLLDKYDMGTYHKGYFREGNNIYLKFKTCEDNIVIPSILQSHILNWDHIYLLYTGIYRTEAMILQHS